MLSQCFQGLLPKTLTCQSHSSLRVSCFLSSGADATEDGIAQGPRPRPYDDRVRRKEKSWEPGQVDRALMKPCREGPRTHLIGSSPESVFPNTSRKPDGTVNQPNSCASQDAVNSVTVSAPRGPMDRYMTDKSLCIEVRRANTGKTNQVLVSPICREAGQEVCICRGQAQAFLVTVFLGFNTSLIWPFSE